MNDPKQFVALYNRSAQLADLLAEKARSDPRRSARLRRSPRSSRRRDFAILYDHLRQDVKKAVGDPNFDRVVLPAWCWMRARYIPFFILGLVGIVAVLTLLLNGVDMALSPVLASVLLLAVSIAAAAPWLSSHDWFQASTLQELSDRAKLLHEYLDDYPNFHPALASGIRRKCDLPIQDELDDLQGRNADLEKELETTRESLETARQESRKYRELLRGWETPAAFEVQDEVLDKLDPLERNRLLEAVQAYRVNAWTPAAAACGMILEGRLQTLCRTNGLPPGGMSEMIRRLGEAGFLHSYYDDLAKIGGFFRNRAAHPTTEEFDREKTTLVLTSLVILIRDLF